jgi:DNA polymerase III delta subunit
MVRKENPVYLFLGEDNLSKDAVLARIKQEALPLKTQEFNLDILYAKDLDLKGLQEKLLFFPLNLSRRVVVVRNCRELKADAKEFLVNYAKNPQPQIILVLDAGRSVANDEFVRKLSGSCQVARFSEEKQLNVFDLSRKIETKQAAASLSILKQLLDDGEDPVRILGGLRASWQRQGLSPVELKKRVKLLLQCDIEIKTGKLKPGFVLERLIVNLCSLKNFLG